MAPTTRSVTSTNAAAVDRCPIERLDQLSGSVVFEDWTSHRDLFSVGTNHRSEELAFQGWQRFKEAFAPELIERAVASSGIKVSRVLDPFGGSGTTALAAQFLGVVPVIGEVNPFLADLIEAKLTRYDITALHQDVEQFVYQVGAISHLAADFDLMPPGVSFLPATFVEPGVKGRWLFSKELFHIYAACLRLADGITDPAHRRLLRVIVGGTLVGQSNVRISGKGRRYRNGWLERQTFPEEAVSAIVAATREALADIEYYNVRAEPAFQLLRGDSRELIASVDEVQLAVFSPPYPNSFDYTDVYNIELWVLGYLTNMQENRDLRLATLSSHVQIKRDFAPEPGGSETLVRTLEALKLDATKLWSPHLPTMVGAYFADMLTVMSNVSERLSPGGQIWMVVGDSRYGGVDIPVANVLNELAVNSGLHHISSEPFRSMRTSPQQGGAEELAETLIVLEKRSL